MKNAAFTSIIVAGVALLSTNVSAHFATSLEEQCPKVADVKAAKGEAGKALYFDVTHNGNKWSVMSSPTDITKVRSALISVAKIGMIIKCEYEGDTPGRPVTATLTLGDCTNKSG